MPMLLLLLLLVVVVPIIELIDAVVTIRREEDITPCVPFGPAGYSSRWLWDTISFSWARTK